MDDIQHFEHFLVAEKKVPYSLSSRTLPIVPVRRLVGCQSYPAIVYVCVIIMSK